MKLKTTKHYKNHHTGKTKQTFWPTQKFGKKYQKKQESFQDIIYERKEVTRCAKKRSIFKT